MVYHKRRRGKGKFLCVCKERVKCRHTHTHTCSLCNPTSMTTCLSLCVCVCVCALFKLSLVSKREHCFFANGLFKLPLRHFLCLIDTLSLCPSPPLALPHQARVLHARQGGPPQRAPADGQGAGRGAERPPGTSRVRGLQPKHRQVLVL